MSLNLMEQPGGLFVVDVDARFYVAHRRTSSRYHAIQPAEAEHPLVLDGKASVGDLVCICPGGVFHGHCWALSEAQAFERRLADDLRWGIDDTEKLPGAADGRVARERAASASPRPQRGRKGTTGRIPMAGAHV